MSAEPSIGTKVAIKFLRNYNEFGSRSHLITAAALFRSMEADSPDSDNRKILGVKLFSEFMAALEDLGAMSIAIRHRADGVGLVYAYLTYGERKEKLSPATSLTQVFKLMQSGNGLVESLLLPPLAEILQARPLFSDSPIPVMYKEANIALAQAANVYLEQNKALVRAYNKTKHGFVVVSDQHTFQPGLPQIEAGTAWIVAKNLEYDPSSPSATTVVELFAIRLTDLQQTLERIPMLRGAIMFITELTALLLEEGIITCADYKA